VKQHHWDWDECRRAVHLVEMLVGAGKYRVMEGAAQSLQRLGHSKEDLEDCLTSIVEAEIADFAPDRDFPGKHILLLKHCCDADTLYVKVSVRLDVDHDPVVRSYHPWGT
jgi:hypothetical protein